MMSLLKYILHNIASLFYSVKGEHTIYPLPKGRHNKMYKLNLPASQIHDYLCQLPLVLI